MVAASRRRIVRLILAGGALLLVAIASWVYVTRRQTLKPFAILPADTGGVHALAFAPDGKTLAYGYKEGRISLWSLAKHQPDGMLEDNNELIHSIVFSPDG